jgi:sulfatase modifying factor 1
MGGTYYRTYTNAGTGPTGEADPATVSSFRLDKYPVTVGRFRQFVNAVLPPDGGAGWLPSPGSGKHAHLNSGNGLSATGGGYEPGWAVTDDSNIAPTNIRLACDDPNYVTWTASAGSRESLPISCVNWYEAYAFCIWDGGFLPSEAEWEYAAAGGSQQREYPWGSTEPGTDNRYAVYGCYYGALDGGVAGEAGTWTCVGAATNIAPVGYAAQGAGLWGQLDLAGEVFEWNLDWYALAFTACTDCADFTLSFEPGGSPGPSDRASRGGAFPTNITSFLLPPTPGANIPTNRDYSQGFRCSRTP